MHAQKSNYFWLFPFKLQVAAEREERDPRRRKGQYFSEYVRYCGLKGPFTQAIFVAATRCNFCRAEVATSKSHV